MCLILKRKVNLLELSDSQKTIFLGQVRVYLQQRAEEERHYGSIALSSLEKVDIGRHKIYHGVRIKKPPKINLKLAAVLALTIIAMATTYTTYAAVTVSQTIPSGGSIAVSPNIGVYSDSTCQTNLTTIDWGTITPGGIITRTIYVKNTGTGTSLSLSMTTSNWNPTTANGPITITWNQIGTILTPGQSVAAVITLTASSTIANITNFAVQITIVGTQ
jgi:hypothetical protein